MTIKAEDSEDFLSIQLYVTQPSDDATSVGDFHLPILAGRPDFAKILQDIASQHQKRRVGTFVCGPTQLSQEVETRCNKATKTSGCAFHFHKGTGNQGVPTSNNLQKTSEMDQVGGDRRECRPIVLGKHASSVQNRSFGNGHLKSHNALCG